MAVFPTTSPRQGAGAKAGWRRDWYRLLFAGDFERLNVDPFFILRLWPLPIGLLSKGKNAAGVATVDDRGKMGIGYSTFWSRR
jgi:hypothetical protein